MAAEDEHKTLNSWIVDAIPAKAGLVAPARFDSSYGPWRSTTRSRLGRHPPMTPAMYGERLRGGESDLALLGPPGVIGDCRNQHDLR